jgi:DNA replication ATP-dependent helicase Dna2
MRKRFDYCIVDEASQLTLPSCIGPLRLAQSFVLVGDHYQLPPLVRSREAHRLGLGQSLFKQLADAHPEAMVSLRSQYRMNEEIMTVANKLVYSNMLQCGSEAVRLQRLIVPRISSFSCTVCGKDSGCWLRAVFDPEKPVLFVDTDACEAYDTSQGSSFFNAREAELINKVNVTLHMHCLIFCRRWLMASSVWVWKRAG